ncbi:fasciclin domain-containing protein [Lutibacter sp. HS1-25]|uniref:fasciclin domain-containing protein n=3 Tax=Lutibacter sp. HS1-25 TaxID=2485000 RepID=UPI001011C54C|nr:fasciclin domain-containing protein [Lutibacter sp. HS1-25]RXP51594.1 fasciclin domain-containing protein [Lutibacter sp. HS1-25]
MKNLKNLLSLFLIIFISVSIVSCDDDDDDDKMPVEMKNTVADFVVANQANYSSLLAALQKANLVETLKGTGPFTVFAPDNAAFSAFLANAGFANLDAVPVDALTQILLNHVVQGDVRSNDLGTGYISSLSTATPNGNKMSMHINTANGVLINGTSKVVNADNIVDNGVIHLVDKVIGLPTIVTIATADANFSTLVAALTRNDQPDFVATLSTANGTNPAPFTVFAPTNAAFGDLLTELNAPNLAAIDGATLTATLTSHVVAGANVIASQLTDNMTVTTLGGDITANISGGATLTDANGRISKIIATNVQTSNGVIHVIDKVVLPYIEPTTNNIADFVVANQANYSNLLAALQKADLVETLKSAGPFTVFAPNNAAFSAFLSDAGFANLDAVPVDALIQILLNHVIMGDVRSTDIETGYVSTLSTATPNGKKMSMYIEKTSVVKINGMSMVTNADNVVDNGVIHLVDKVIGLPTVVTFATSNANFSTLVAALTRNDQPNFVATLSTANGTNPAPFTVFAPTNEAFGNLLTELNAPNLAAIDAATLTATLNSHVVAGANVIASQLSDNMTVTTLGGNITANVTGGAKLTDANNRNSNIIAYDVQASNGVVHVIDKVILPALN